MTIEGPMTPATDCCSVLMLRSCMRVEYTRFVEGREEMNGIE
jgi:hypothetical protein